MSFSYGGKPGESEVDTIRFMIGDTIEEGALLQDEEINYILQETSGQSWSHTMAKLFRHVANIYNARLIKRSLGPQSEDASSRAKYFSIMASRYEKLLAYSGAPPLPEYQSTLVFSKDMMSNGSSATTAEVE